MQSRDEVVDTSPLHRDEDLGAVADVLGASAWMGIWRALGVDSAPMNVHHCLLDAYSEPNRAYHTRQHLSECLEFRVRMGQSCAHPAEIDLALWFHDAIYDTARNDNEARSAQWLVDVAKAHRLSASVQNRIVELVLVTRHNAAPSTADEAVLVDTDLAILGAATHRFDEYEAQVRREYSAVPMFLYKRGRRKVLEKFIRRDRIYVTDPFSQMFEEQARINLRRSLERLK